VVGVVDAILHRQRGGGARSGAGPALGDFRGSRSLAVVRTDELAVAGRLLCLDRLMAKVPAGHLLSTAGIAWRRSAPACGIAQMQRPVRLGGAGVQESAVSETVRRAARPRAAGASEMRVRKQRLVMIGVIGFRYGRA
jgi:hypothetical protein